MAPAIKQVDLKSTKAKDFYYSKPFTGVLYYDWLLSGAPRLQETK